ncbi:MAG: hypothetical protein IK032_00005, partial [Bacteroidales bacterium]|nr:hypothetical protein [Bacteroidales bacterium]
MKRIVQLLLVAIIMLPMSAKSQSATDTVPYCCNFESAVERVYWRFANSNENKWAMGIANSNGGLYGLYISNDGG